jgi:hypothetical protein
MTKLVNSITRLKSESTPSRPGNASERTEPERQIAVFPSLAARTSSPDAIGQYSSAPNRSR